MLAATLTVVLFGFILTIVVDVMRRDGAKIAAALEGHSWTARPVLRTLHSDPLQPLR